MARYRIHNTSRDVKTRMARLTSGQKLINLILGGGMVRVTPGKSVDVDESVLVKLRAELLMREAGGFLKVTDLCGARVDINTLAVTEQPPPESPPVPVLLDSANNDVTFEYGVGNAMPQFAGGLPETDNPEVPAIVSEYSKNAAEDEAMKAEHEAALEENRRLEEEKLQAKYEEEMMAEELRALEVQEAAERDAPVEPVVEAPAPVEETKKKKGNR